MANAPSVSYEVWRDICLHHGHADFSADFDKQSPADRAAADAREQHIASIAPAALADHLIRFLSHPDPAVDQLGDGLLADALWFIFGTGGMFFAEVFSKEVPIKSQAKCISSLPQFYHRVLDRRCNDQGRRNQTETHHTVALDTAVYMIWDMTGVERCLRNGGQDGTALAAAGFDALQTILLSSLTSTCQISALHGLGHAEAEHPVRVHQIIDAFLERPEPTPVWVKKYAVAARDGNVQ